MPLEHALMRDIGLSAWLAKDLGWVLLSPVLAWPAAIIAVGIESHLAISEWNGSSTGMRMHTFAELCWLVGNCIWMTAELLFDKKSESIFPWYHGTVLEYNEKAYNIGANISLVILCVGFFALLSYYMLRLAEYLSRRERRQTSTLAQNPQDAATLPQSQDLVFGHIPEEIYKRMFLFPWIAKDICWNVDWTTLLLVFAVSVVILALDYIRRYGGSEFWAELFWFCGNAIWAFSELFERGPQTRLRLIAAAFLAVGLMCVSWPTVFPWPRSTLDKETKERAHEAACEREPLVRSGGDSGSARGLSFGSTASKC
mmetsp:Transcript_96473/g.241947  ORF Transcript_96473/g.241947 Transcript_96473/m.241947 type:complete len:313 (+) Transcript_96473:233-1171(+)